jgi:hypothetical protein
MVTCKDQARLNLTTSIVLRVDICMSNGLVINGAKTVERLLAGSAQPQQSTFNRSLVQRVEALTGLQVQIWLLLPIFPMPLAHRNIPAPVLAILIDKSSFLLSKRCCLSCPRKTSLTNMEICRIQDPDTTGCHKLRWCI